MYNTNKILLRVMRLYSMQCLRYIKYIPCMPCTYTANLQVYEVCVLTCIQPNQSKLYLCTLPCIGLNTA